MIQAPSTQRHSGFSLIELVISIVIISIALSGTILSSNMANLFSSDPSASLQAVNIAQGYMDEILNKTFPTTFPCPAPPVGGRSAYANVCDYQGLVNVGAQDQSGTTIPGLSAYTITVNIDGTTASMGTLTAGTQVVRVDVTVTRNLMPTLKLSGYRTNY